MAKKRTKLFSSQIRYLEKNPIVSFRLKKEEKEKLEEIVKNTNSSVSKWVSDFVRGKVENEEEKLKLLEANRILEKANEILRTKIETVIRFKIPCSICGKDIIVTPSDENWNSYAYPQLIDAFKTACHRSCKNKF